MKKQKKDSKKIFHENPDDVTPQSFDTECYILGSVLQQNALLDKISFLRPEHFFTAENARIYEIITEMHADDMIVNPLTLQACGELDDTLRRYVMKIYANSSMLSTLYDPVILAEQIVDLWRKREAIRLLRDTVNDIMVSNYSAQEHYHAVTTKMEGLFSARVNRRFRTNIDVAKEILSTIDKPIKPFSTGIKHLDDAMGGGIFPGMNYIFAARKKVGKTSLAATISGTLNRDGITHLYIC